MGKKRDNGIRNQPLAMSIANPQQTISSILNNSLGFIGLIAEGCYKSAIGWRWLIADLGNKYS
jgi:hypothetical protein